MKAYRIPGAQHLYAPHAVEEQTAVPYLFWHYNGGDVLDELPTLWAQNKLGIVLLPALHPAQAVPASLSAVITAFVLAPPVTGQLSFIVAVDEQGRPGGYVYVDAAGAGNLNKLRGAAPFQSFGFALSLTSSQKVAFSPDRILFEDNETRIQGLGSGFNLDLAVRGPVAIALTGPQAGRIELPVTEILASPTPTDFIGILFHYQPKQGKKQAEYLPFAFFSPGVAVPAGFVLTLHAHPFGSSPYSAATRIVIDSPGEFATAFTQSNGAPVRVRVPAPGPGMQPPEFIIQQLPSNSDNSVKSYFAPQGDFALLDNSGRDWQILLSQTGSQYLRIPGNAQARLRFIVGNASFVPATYAASKIATDFDTSLAPAERLGAARPGLKPGSTSWAQVITSEPLLYMNEAEKHLFYEPAPGGGDAAASLSDEPAAALVAVETGALQLAQPAVFPLLPLAGMAAGVATGWGPKLEELMVSPARHAHIARQASPQPAAIVAYEPDPVCSFRVTPQGFVIVYALEQGQEHYYYLLFSVSADDYTLGAGQRLSQLRAHIEQFVYIREPDADYLSSLLRDQLMLVTSSKLHSLGQQLQTKLSIRILGEAYTFDWFDHVAQAGYMVQKYHDQPLSTLLEQTGLWSNYNSYRNKVDELQKGVKDYLLKEQLKPAVKELLHDILTAPHWRGVLVMNTQVKLPEPIKVLMKKETVPLACLAFEGSQVLNTVNSLQVRKPSFTAMIAYEDLTGFAPAGPKQIADYKVSELYILFRNTEIADFRCTIKLKIQSLFLERLADADKVIELRGSYSRGPEGERYVFAADTSYELKFPATSLLQKIQLNRIEYGGSKGPDGQQHYQFTIDGKLYFNSSALVPVDLLSIEEIDFRNLALRWPLDRLPEITLDLPQLAFNFDSAKLRQAANSLLSAFPLKFKQFHFSLAPLSIAKLGFESFALGGKAGADFTFGFSFEFNLGGLGGLADGLKDLKADIFLGWQPIAGAYQLAYGIRFPDFEGQDLQIGIQSFIRIILRELTLKFDVGQVFFHSPDVRVELLGQSYPKSQDSRIGALIFRPKKTGTQAAKTAWLLGYTSANAEEKQDIFIGAGQRFLESSRLDQLATTDAAVDAMQQLVSSMPPAKVTPAILQQYNEELDWLFALRLRGVFSVLDVSVALYDPRLYGLFLRLPTMGNLSVDIMYKKLGSGIGEWSTDLTLPDSLRHWDFGAVAVTIPSLFVALYTNGGFRVDAGFPRGMDYSRSFVVQAFPFIGWGGFYFAMTRGRVPNTFCEQQYPAVAVGFALRVGLGRQFNRGMLKAGLSVSVFGVLQGAANFAPGQSVLEPHELYLSGRVGIIAEVYGYVDFGLIKAAIHIVAQVSMGFHLQTNQATLLFIEAGVHVRIKLVIGSFKVFGKRYKITVSLSFSTTLRFDWQLGQTTGCGPSAQVLAAEPPRFQALKATELRPVLELIFYFEYTQAEGGLQALPMLCLAEKSAENADGRQYPRSFAALVSYLEDRIWQSADTAPDGVITYAELRGYEQRIAQQAYADMLPGEPVETLFQYQFGKLAELKDEELQAGVGYLTSFFPMLPGVVLKSGLFAEDGGEIDYARVQVSGDYKQVLQQYFEQLFVHRDTMAVAASLTVPPPVALAQLMLEDYVEMLLKSLVDLHLGRVEAAYQRAHSPDGPPAVQRLSSLAAAEQVKAYNDLSARINRFVRHGLKLPVDTHLQRQEPIFRYLKQQFPVVAGSPEVALYYGGTLQVKVQPDYSPELGQAQLTGPLHRHAGPRPRWAHQNYTSGLRLTVLLPAALGHQHGFLPVGTAVRSRLRQSPQPGQAPIPTPVFRLCRHNDQQVGSSQPVGYQLGTLLEFTIAPATTGPGAAGDFYALRGLTAEQLVPLLDVLQAPATLQEVSLYYSPAEEPTAAYKRYMGSGAGIRLFKINLSTESAPPVEENAARLLDEPGRVAETFVAAASEPRAFLEILSAAGIINQEGIFLQLPSLPASAGGSLRIALFVQSQPVAISGATATGALHPYHTHLLPAQELPDGMEYYWETSDWQEYVPLRPPAVVAFEVHRPAVEEVPDQEEDKAKIARQTLENLYSLLDFKLLSKASGQPGFTTVAEHNTLPVSPVTKEGREDTWCYEQGIRVPTPGGNRYERIGDAFQVSFGWRDVYGNSLAGLSFQGPVETLQYVDLLLGADAWPGTVPAYAIVADNRLALTLAQGLHPDMWATAGAGPADSILAVYQLALEQLQGPGVTASARVELRTSEGQPLANTRMELPAAALLRTYLQGAIQALVSVRDQQFSKLTLTAMEVRLTQQGSGSISVVFRAADERLAYLSAALKLQVNGKDAATDAYSLAHGTVVVDANKMFATYGKPDQKFVDVKLTLVSPQGVLLARQALELSLNGAALAGLQNPAYLAVGLQIARAQELIPQELRAETLAATPRVVGADAVQQVRTDVLPAYVVAPAQANEPHQPERVFAKAVEQYLGGKSLRLGTGLDLAGQARYWLVPRIWTDLRLTGKPAASDYTVYAPRPVLNRLFSMSKAVEVLGTSAGAQPATRPNLDLDVLFRCVLAGLDQLLQHERLPGLAAPPLAGSGPTALDELLIAKQAVARWYPAKRLTTLYEGAPVTKLAEAQAGLRQEMLRKSTHAYLQDLLLSYRLRQPARLPGQLCRLHLEVEPQPATSAGATEISIAPLKVELTGDAPLPELLLKVNYTRNDFAPDADALISFRESLLPTYLEHSIRKTDALGAYESSRWIKLHLADPESARLELRADQVQIVQRQYPSLPAVSSHGCLPAALESGGTWAQQLRSSRRWRYQLELLGPSIGQDKGRVALYLGAQPGTGHLLAEDWNEAERIVAAAELWGALEPRLQGPPDATTLALVVQFARHLQALADAPPIPEAALPPAQALAGYQQTVHWDYRLVPVKGKIQSLHLRPAGPADAAVLQSMADPAQTDSVEIVYAAVDPQDPAKTIELRVRYPYLRTEAGEWIFGPAAGQAAVELTALRRVSFRTPPLDLLRVPDAETGIYVTRNESLLQGKKIAKEFVYTTEEFRSARPLRPFVEHALPLVYPAGTGLAAKPSCHALLHETFAALLETASPLAGARAVVASCECYYLYMLPYQADWRQATRRGLFLKEGIPGSEAGLRQALPELSHKLSAWAQEFEPVAEGALGMAITLSLDSGPLLLHLPYVVLPLSAFAFEPAVQLVALTAPAGESLLPAAQLQEVLSRLETIEQLLLALTPEPDDLHDQEEPTEDTPAEPQPGPPVAGSPAQEFERFIDNLKLAHFRGREFTPYWSRISGGVKNSLPPKELWPNIVPTLVVLNALRAQLQAPVLLTSTYRSPAYNRAVGGEPKSFHQTFQAIDFTCTVGSPCRWAGLLRQLRNTAFTNPLTGKPFTFQGGIGIYRRKNFVHLDTRGYRADWYGKGDQPCP
ncbi:D-Ala-D-Ala carboxypeptidase family metallohydrolase [Hymenobacter tenuis]